ncbi:haloacid dehalogenase-like hydrolase domain-containing 5 [Acanthaster planci]|uniref:Haloacid dehalogenase-like hydrolase domain-containing 5 n=1 Tax=Acanthaster planci TaxID=133434 RepID=A0A8B7YRT6_ACAPL|nr:haloacid dehalogenase-like hydrolase domain-containing 5 [Acanthaster planci]
MAAARNLPRILLRNFPHFKSSLSVFNHPRRFFSIRPELCSQTPPFGILFDIDGVIVRGKRVLDQAIDAFQKLSDGQGQLRVPVVFVTNAGNKLRQHKAKQLTEWLGIKIHPDQVVMSHSPLKMFPQFHDRHVLVSGQGPIKEIAKGLGFTKVTTVDEVRDMFPHLDMVDHQRRVPAPDANVEIFLPRIEAVVLFGEPVRWETSLQLILDMLITNGQLSHTPDNIPYPNIPVLGCNVDLMWMSEAHLPRLGHGSFMVCLESLYKKITGRDLLYTVLTGKPSQVTYHCAENVLSQQARAMGCAEPLRTLYAIGDNPMTDIYGANLYNQYLTAKAAKGLQNPTGRQPAAIRQGEVMSDPHDNIHIEAGDTVDSTNHPVSEIDHHVCESEALMTDTIDDGFPVTMESVLVYTGLHSKPDDMGQLDESHLELDHGHRDFEYNKALIKPTITAQHVLDAVNIIFDRENFK